MNTYSIFFYTYSFKRIFFSLCGQAGRVAPGGSLEYLWDTDAYAGIKDKFMTRVASLRTYSPREEAI